MLTEPIRILLVEGSSDDARRLREILCQRGEDSTRVAHVATAREAGGLLQRESFDAVLLGVEDWQVALDDLRWIRRRPVPPILLLAHREGGEQQRWAVREGALDCLLKGHVLASDPEYLRRLVRYAVALGRLRGELDQARRLNLHLAHHDILTDLPNRSLFQTRLSELIAQARRCMRPLAVLFLDLDRFKQINDTLGHGAGDLLIRQAALRLSGCIRESDIASRRGGDEFTVILDGTQRAADAGVVARKILAAFAQPFDLDGQSVYVTPSIGISLFPTDGDDVETLVRHADIAMYRAKARGGNCFVFFQPEVSDRAMDKMEMEQSLRAALERDEFRLHYQAQVDVKSGRIMGMEALVRWQHPELGMVSPGTFIPLAEETGMILPLGDWVLETACAQNMAWRHQGLPPIAMAVNFSARQFQFRQPVERVARVLESTGLDAGSLDLELTESVVMNDANSAIETMQELRELGVHISIDDFGIGQSSLSYLKRFPINRLKIDQSFIRTLLVDPKDAAIATAIIDMAHTLGLQAVAEGVENNDQLEFLRPLGCDFVQGYFLSRPLAPDEAGVLQARQDVMVPSRN